MITNDHPSRVFLVERNARFDISGASKFGTTVFLCEEGDWNPMNTGLYPSLIRKALETHDFRPEEDFVCLTGQNMKVAMFLAVMANDFDTLRLLIFDATRSAYCERPFSVVEDSEAHQRTA